MIRAGMGGRLAVERLVVRRARLVDGFDRDELLLGERLGPLMPGLSEGLVRCLGLDLVFAGLRLGRGQGVSTTGSGADPSWLFPSRVRNSCARQPGSPGRTAARPRGGELARRLVRRVVARQGLDEDGATDAEADVASLFAAASVPSWVADGPEPRRPRRLRTVPPSTPGPALAASHAQWARYDLHAGVRVAAGPRDRLERVVRYALRPALAEERLTRTAAGDVAAHLRRPWADGTTPLVFTPSAFLARVAALVPRPRVNLLLYQGVLAPRAAWRREVVSSAVAPSTTPSTPDNADQRQGRGWRWADRVTTLDTPATITGQQFLISRVHAVRRSGYDMTNLDGAFSEVTAAAFPAGSFVVDMAQPMANAAFSYLEPQSRDGFVGWGVLDETLTALGARERPTVYPVFKARRLP